MVTVNLDNEQLELIQEGLRLLKINCIEEIYTQQANELNYTKCKSYTDELKTKIKDINKLIDEL